MKSIMVYDDELVEELEHLADDLFQEMRESIPFLADGFDSGYRVLRAELKRQLARLGLRLIVGLERDTVVAALKASENWSDVIRRDAEQALTTIYRQADPAHPHVRLPDNAPRER